MSLFAIQISRSKELIVSTIMSYVQTSMDLKKLLRQLTAKANEADLNAVNKENSTAK